MDEKCKKMLDLAVNELSDKDRVIMRLHLAGENEVLIGKVFKVTQQAISKHIRRIKTQLAERCTRLYGENHDY